MMKDICFTSEGKNIVVISFPFPKYFTMGVELIKVHIWSLSTMRRNLTIQHYVQENLNVEM